MRTFPLLTATALVGGLVGASPAVAAPGEEFVRGSVQNKVQEQGRPTDTRTVSVHATEQDGEVSGQVNFRHVRHQAPSGESTGLSKFRGSVDCLQVSGDVVRVAGVVTSGSTSAGGTLTGKSYALEFDLAAGEFRLPDLSGTPGFAPAEGGDCATSGRELVDITSGQLRTSS